MNALDLFTPVTSGIFATELAPNFLPALAERVRRGLFPMSGTSRNAYEVIELDETGLRFRSTNLWSAINVGLNDVSVNLRDSNELEYTIRFWTWTKYAALLCLTIFVLLLLALTVGRSVFPPAWFADFDKAPWLGSSMLIFWGPLWPWLLTAMHKKSVRYCLERILFEVNESIITSD